MSGTMTAKTVQVEQWQIDEGVAGSCYYCPVALALVKATGDKDANVVEQEWRLYLSVWGRLMPAPESVRHFVRRFDALPRDDNNKPNRSSFEDGDALPAPFAFELPGPDDPAWEETCSGCGELFEPCELDEDGYCLACAKGDLE
jgi:hypothetical protein